jgi:hypothetical protein
VNGRLPEANRVHTFRRAVFAPIGDFRLETAGKTTTFYIFIYHLAQKMQWFFRWAE